MTLRIAAPLFLCIAAALALATPTLAGPPSPVTVSTHAGLVDKDAKRLDKVDGAREVEAQLTTALAKAGATGVTVRVEIDEFRLRTQKQIAWGGLASGGDFIGAQVTITPEGGEPRTLKAKGVLVTGSIAGKEPKRLATIVEGLVEDVVAGL